MSIKEIPTIEILELLNYMKVHNGWKEYAFLYDEYMTELGRRVPPLIHLY